MTHILRRTALLVERHPALLVCALAAVLVIGLAMVSCNEEDGCDRTGPYPCDPNANYNAPMRCEWIAGFVGGSTNVSCTAQCQWDVSGCHRCGDGVCNEEEDATSCFEDCPSP